MLTAVKGVPGKYDKERHSVFENRVPFYFTGDDFRLDDNWIGEI